MLSQAHLLPLTEENLKKHQREATTERIPSKKSTTRISKSGKSLRSAGDGESIEFVSDEALKTSLEEHQGNEKQTFDAAVVLPSDPTTCAVAENMSKLPEANLSPDDSTRAEVETSPKGDNDRISNEEEEQPDNDKATEPADQKNDAKSYGRNSEGASESENEGSEGDSAESSSSPLESDSDVTALPKSENDNKEGLDSNDTAGSARSSSESDDDDDEDDDDDDDDDDTTDDNEDEEGMRSEDELTHYTSSLNASVSSIPTLYDDREASIQSPTSSAEETPKECFDQGNEEEGLLEQKPEAAAEEVTEVEAEKVEEEVPLKKVEVPMEKEQVSSDYTPPGSRQVSGRSATPKTVVLSEFDDVESTIFDRREQSGRGSSSQNKSTTSINSGKSDVSIKNWAEFARVTSVVTSNGEGVTELAAVPEKAKCSKRLKTRTVRNANKPSNSKETKNSKAKTKKQRPASNLTAKEGAIRRQLTKKSSISSDNSVAVYKLQTKIVRRKRRPVKQVSFDKLNIENLTKTITSDSAFFGSRTESRGEEQSSPKPPESDFSDRASSRWSAVETERASTSSIRPVSTAQSTHNSLSLSQRSRQTPLVEQVTAANHPPPITGKKAHLPALRYRPRGKWTSSRTQMLVHCL